jgi:hypothetical protein
VKSRLKKIILNRNLKRNDRKSSFISISEAKSVGIIFNSTDTTTIQTILECKSSLEKSGKKIIILGVGSKNQTLPGSINGDHIKFISNKDCNWLGLPRPEAAADFLQTNLDLLFDFSNGDNFILQYILSLSNAKMIIGHDIEHSGRFYDFIIKKGQQINLKNHIENIFHYLNQIKNN